MATADLHATGTFAEHFDAVLGSLALPPAELEARTRALDAYLRAGLPSHKSEEFKYTPLSELQSWDLAPATESTPAPAGIAPFPDLEGATLVLVNGVVASGLESPRIPGVTFETFEQAPEPAIATYAGKLGTTNDPRFLDLNRALFRQGLVVRIAAGAVVETPIHIVHVTSAPSGPLAVHPRLRIETGRGAIVKLVESYVGSGQAFTNAVTEIAVAADAVVEHTRVQLEPETSIHVGNLFVHQESGSTYTSNNVQFGAKIGRCDINVFSNGEHTETWLNGAYVGHNAQILDNHTRIDHAMPNCHSFEVYKGILADRAQGVFNGKIFVYLDAQKTDAKQTNQAILLSPEASVNTKPQLEIFADDVKCTHGATVGQLREDALFYLRSRGLSALDARNVLIHAFAAEALEKITLQPVRERLEAMLFEKLGVRA